MGEAKEILINGKTLEKILENHKHWLNRDIDGWKNLHADLIGANLRYADLRGADLRGADLIDANLRNADLIGANLRYANLNSADLIAANLRHADLRYANLNSADLIDANLRHADLRGAILIDANLRHADLRGANLRYAELRDANLRHADLRGANLRYANLRYANLNSADLNKEDQIRKGVKLSTSITGWKKCKYGVIVKLEIPRGAIVFSINNNKCRTDRAIVKEIIGSDRAYSMHKYFSYYVGDKIEVYNFNCEYNTECVEGIHFFRTRKEAENYNY